MIAVIRLAREQQMNVRLIPTINAIVESVELAHGVFNRVFRRIPPAMRRSKSRWSRGSLDFARILGSGLFTSTLGISVFPPHAGQLRMCALIVSWGVSLSMRNLR